MNRNPKTSTGEIGFDGLNPRVDLQSPLLISSSPGIVTFKEALILADGNFYLGAFADEWRVHVAGQPVNYEQTEPRTSGGTINRQDNNINGSVVAYHNGKPVLSIPLGSTRGLAATNFAPDIMDKQVFNIATFWNRGGMTRYGDLESTHTNTKELVTSH